MIELDQDREFNNADLEILMTFGAAVMSRADSGSANVYSQIEELDVIIGRIGELFPDAWPTAGLVAAVDEARNYMIMSDMSRYSRVQKQLVLTAGKLIYDIPFYDRQCADAAGAAADLMDNTIEKIDLLIDLLTDPPVSNIEKFQKKIDKASKELAELDEDAADLAGELALFLAGIDEYANCYINDPVNTATGSFVFTGADLPVGGSCGLSHTRTYNALGSRAGAPPLGEVARPGG